MMRILDERTLDDQQAESMVRHYLDLVLPGLEILELRQRYRRRVVVVWDVEFKYKGEIGRFFLVGGDLPHLLLDKEEGMTSVAEALTVYCSMMYEWFRLKGDYLKSDLFLPKDWSPLDYWSDEHTDWLSPRLDFIVWDLLPKMIYDGELKNPDIQEMAVELGNDSYYQQLLDSGDIDEEEESSG